jgi:Uma2 family endonuclease
MGMPLSHRRFTVDDYHRMAHAGILGPDERVELLDGEIVEMSPIGSRHAGTVARVHWLFHRLAADRALVWVRNPIRLDRHSEPQPDVTLLRPRGDFYTGAHPGPGDVLLLVEVADVSLRHDRTRKIPAYAGAGIPEVWLVDLTTERIEVYRDPAAGYATRRTVERGASLSPLGLPGVVLATDEILG